MACATIDLAAVTAIRRAAASGEMRNRRIRACAGLRETAGAIGVAPPALSVWERGKTRPTAEHAIEWETTLRDIEGSAT